MATLPNHSTTPPTYPDLRPEVPPRASSTPRNLLDKGRRKLFPKKDKTIEKIKQNPDPDLINKLAPETQAQLPVELLNELDVNRLHNLRSHILDRVSEIRIRGIPESQLRELARHHPRRLAVVLTKAPELAFHLDNDEIRQLQEVKPATFMALPPVIKDRFHRACPEVYQQILSQAQRALHHQPVTTTPPGDAQVRAQHPVRPTSVQSSPIEPPTLPLVNFSQGPHSDFTQEIYHQTNVAVQGASGSLYPNQSTQSPPSVAAVPRAYSHPQNTYHGQVTRNLLSSASPPPSSNPPRHEPPINQPFNPPIHTLVDSSKGPSRSSSPTGYFTQGSQSYTRLQGHLNSNGIKPLQHPESKSLPAVPVEGPDPQILEALQNVQMQREVVLPIQVHDPQSFQVRQISQTQGELAAIRTKDDKVRELEAQVEAWKLEKSALVQQVTSLTASLTVERERLESERQSTGPLHKSIGRLETEKERLENEKKLVEADKKRLESDRDRLEREQIKLEGGIKHYLSAKEWKGLQHPKAPFDMIIDYCNEQLSSAADWEDYYKQQTKRLEDLKLENGRLVQDLKDQDELILARNEWWRKYTELEKLFNRMNLEHEQKHQEEKKMHQFQLQEEKNRQQQRFTAETDRLNVEIECLKKKLDTHEARHKDATESLRTTLESDKQGLRDEIATLQREKDELQEQHQSRYDGYQAELQRLKGANEVKVGQQNAAHQAELKALAEHCQQLLDNVGYQYELNKQQAVKGLENKVRLLESSLVDNSDDYRPATDDHLQVDFDQLNLDINKITHNLPPVDFFQVSQLDPDGFLDREGRDQLRFLLQGIFWEHMKSGFFSSPFGLGALGPRDGKRRLLEVWIAYRKLLGTGASDVRLPIGDYDLAAIEQDYIKFLRDDKETNKWRSSTFQAVMAALLPKKDKGQSPLAEYLSSPFFQNRNHVRESILAKLRLICVGGISQAIEQTVEGMVYKASELALQFGMQRAELGLDFPQKNTLVMIGQGFVICYDNDAEHGMEKPVFLGVSPTCYKRGDGRNDTTTTKVISPGHIYPHPH
ncbi:hypothetical protein QBC36DRAFT_181717 [Triangularia setosa]|uniref:Uncharacterized protein n=1 Tax=Triangularia setosa TaxID=2587417 RepID=A0AAN6WB81_9PEZI|nr:hypothetical protein QBC36DRAFT_181717 [Podospora setosa]